MLLKSISGHFASLRHVALPPQPTLALTLWHQVRLPLPALFLMAAVFLLLGCTPGRFSQTGNGWSPATGLDGSVYVGTKQGTVTALTDNGFEGSKTLWTFPANRDGDSEDGVALFGI